MGYCEVFDLYAFGLARGSVPFPARLIASVSTSLDALELDGHGLSADDLVSFRAEAGGSLPNPLAEGVTYYAQPVDDSWFCLSAAAGGSVIDLGSAGSRVLLIVRLNPEAAIEWASGLINDMVPSAVVPLTAPYPPIVVATCAELAAHKLAALAGAATVSLGVALDAAQKRLERWARGVPIRGANAPASTAVAASGVASGTTDLRGWARYGGLA